MCVMLETQHFEDLFWKVETILRKAGNLNKQKKSSCNLTLLETLTAVLKPNLSYSLKLLLNMMHMPICIMLHVTIILFNHFVWRRTSWTHWSRPPAWAWNLSGPVSSPRWCITFHFLDRTKRMWRLFLPAFVSLRLCPTLTSAALSATSVPVVARQLEPPLPEHPPPPLLEMPQVNK